MELLRRGENLAAGLAVLKRYFLTAQVTCRAGQLQGREGYLPTRQWGCFLLQAV